MNLKKQFFDKYICMGLSSFVVVGFIWICFACFFLSPSLTSDKIGDSYGSLNTLFSGLAFAFLVINILMQKEQLALQKNELQMQREELSLNRIVFTKQKEEMETQSNLMELQSFESTFFNSLSMFQSNIIDQAAELVDVLQKIEGLFESQNIKSEDKVRVVKTHLKRTKMLTNLYCTIRKMIIMKIKEEKAQEYYLEFLTSQLSSSFSRLLLICVILNYSEDNFVDENALFEFEELYKFSSSLQAMNRGNMIQILKDEISTKICSSSLIFDSKKLEELFV